MEGRSSIRWATWRWMLIAGFAIIGALNLPGHLAFDSVTALWEGRHHLRMSWGPRMYSAILGFFDAIVPGAGLFAVFDMALVFFAWLALPKLRGRLSWAGPPALALAFLLPQVLIYQGIVWRDVLYANLTVAAFVSLALAARYWSTKTVRWPLLAAAAMGLAVGALVRQNGGVVMAPAAVAVGWIAAPGRLGRAVAWAVGGLAVMLLLAFALDVANPVREPPGHDHAIGLRLLAHYDLMAAVAENPARPLPVLAAEAPDRVAVMRREAPRVYSPQRIDFLDRSRALGPALWRYAPDKIYAQWENTLASDPVGYARRRLEVFRWVFLTPDLIACVPLHLGVSGLPHIQKELGLVDGHWVQDSRLYQYSSLWFATPAYSHLAYALLAVVVTVLLLIRRSPPDIAMAGLMVGVLGFAGTFLVVSIACDYRYLYALDLAAITGALYLAVDPSLRRRRAAT